ncbi:hypothetical protein WR25_00531 [Diploscapter pachys]|uniref:Uncharacterized protein n=1 Tax=Diploscapter pachys TaxID=2018661 RepID=A0A2A2KKP8_9BILA|nr:hypothetical protein WR25_00531 [Diploscapter pachys]
MVNVRPPPACTPMLNPAERITPFAERSRRGKAEQHARAAATANQAHPAFEEHAPALEVVAHQATGRDRFSHQYLTDRREVCAGAHRADAFATHQQVDLAYPRQTRACANADSERTVAKLLFGLVRIGQGQQATAGGGKHHRQPTPAGALVLPVADTQRQCDLHVHLRVVAAPFDAAVPYAQIGNSIATGTWTAP